MSPGQILSGKMSWWQLQSVVYVPRTLCLKFDPNRSSESWDIADMDKSHQDIWVDFYYRIKNDRDCKIPILSFTAKKCCGSGNILICHGEICPYQQYLGCYWTDFEHTIAKNIASFPSCWMSPNFFCLYVYRSKYYPNHALVVVDWIGDHLMIRFEFWTGVLRFSRWQTSSSILFLAQETQ